MDTVLQELRDKGYRITNQRKCLVAVLTSKPQSVVELKERLSKKGIRIDKVTLYRALQCLVALGIVGKTKFTENTSKYELLTNAVHHHHLVCNKCGAVKDLPVDDSSFINKVVKNKDFKVASHSLEIFGCCSGCT